MAEKMSRSPSGAADVEFERRRWEKEVEFRERELAIKQQEAAVKDREAATKEREQRLKNRELRLKVIEFKRSRVMNPLFLAILGATIAGTFTAIGAGIAAWTQIRNESTRALAQQDIERAKADSQLILEMIKTNSDTKAARANLEFAIGAGLITDTNRRAEIQKFLKGPQQPPSLPASAPAPPASQRYLGVSCTLPRTTDIQKLVATVEAELKKNDAVRKVQTSVDTDSAKLAAEIAIIAGSLTVGKITVSIRRTPAEVLLTNLVEIMGSFFVSLVPVPNSTSAAKETTEMLEKAVGAGNANCRSDI